MSYFISDGFLDKKAEPLTIKGSAINSLFRFFFSHECVKDFFDHVPFSFCFNLF